MSLDFLPASLHRAGLRLAHCVRKIWWRWRRPEVLGCGIMLFDARGHVLLVRHSYGRDHWALPGGAIGRREDPAEAARRELREEVGCDAHDLAHFGSATRNLHGASNRVEMFAGSVKGHPAADCRDIVEVRFFALDALPEPLAVATALWLAEYSDSQLE